MQVNPHACPLTTYLVGVPCIDYNYYNRENRMSVRKQKGNCSIPKLIKQDRLRDKDGGSRPSFVIFF